MANITITNTKGFIFDSGGSSGKYKDNENLVLVINPNIPGYSVHFKIIKYALETGWDYLYIYNGPTTNDP
jgi:hypothetical protein